MGRAKAKMPEMMPAKKWLSKREAMAFLDVSVNEFQKIAGLHKLSFSCLHEKGVKKYYKVSELNAILDRNTIQKQTA